MNHTSKAIKKLLLTLVAMLLVTTIVSLPVEAKTKSSTINKTKVTVCTKKSYTLKITNASKKVKWTTSDKKNLKIKPSGKKNENCKVTTSNKKGTYTVTAKVGKKKYTTKVKVAGHKYGKVTYKWNKDYSKCTASKKCSRCGKTLKQTVKASSKTTTKATCTEKGAKKYTAKFTKYSFGTKKKNVSIKALGHAFDKATYKWNASYSACTAKAVCSRCNASVSEKATVTSKVTKQATKSATGVRTHTATFKNKDFSTQTKNVTIPKLAYLDKTSITIKYGQPATIKVVNGTLGESAGPNAVCSSYKDLVKFDGGECDTTNAYDEDLDVFSEKSNVTYKKSKDMTSITFYAIKEASDKTYTVSLLLSNGQTLKCNVTTEFTPGDYTFGKIGLSYTNQGYMGWGKYKGKYPNSAEYVEYCGDKEKYDKYKSFFDNQTLRDGTTGTLEDLAAQTRDACSERSLYKSKARLEWEALSYEVQENTYGGDFFNYIREKYGEVGIVYHLNCGTGFQADITSNAQLKKIVDDWTRVSGEVPSWYYYTAFSDWAEWCGRDIGMFSYPTYDENLNFCTYTPPALPSNFRD